MNLFILFIISTAVLSYFTFAFLLKRSSLNQLKKNNDKGERWATLRKPIIGGIGFYVAFIASSIFLVIGNNKNISYREVGTLLIICSLGFFSGLWDDIKGSTPRLKLIIQLLISIIFIVTGNSITAFDSNWINYPITIFWVIALMNSINMLDNMDAITTSVSAVIIASLTIIGFYLTISSFFIIYVSIGILISLIIFLKWNWNPSKMFMGDNGSQFLGAFISFLGIKIIWNNNIQHSTEFPIQEIIAVSLCFIAMISDTATVTINRLRKGKSPFIGGKDHTTHHLYYLGLHERQVAFSFIGISIIANCATFYILCIDKQLSVLQSMLWLIVALVIFAAMYSSTIFGKPLKK